MIFLTNKFMSVSKIMLLWIASLLSSTLMAQQVSQLDFFDLSLEELLQIDVTIATKTALKEDDLPGMVSILRSADLEHYGYANLWEALGSLPGIQLSSDSTGTRQLVVRGVGKTYTSGIVKMLLNGVAMNSTISANAQALMNLPVAQIKRIELIRGPGSAVHGEFSYAGVINVITKQTGGSIYAVLGSENTTQVGGHYEWFENEKDVSASLNFSTLQSDGADLESGLDSGSLFSVPGYSSGAVNTKRKMNSILYNIDYKNINVSLQWLDSKRGDHFGINDYLPPDEREIRINDESLSLHSHIKFEISSTLSITSGFNWLKTSIRKNQQFAGSALVFAAPVTNPDVVANVLFKEQRLEAYTSLIATMFDDHVLFAEISQVNAKVTDAEQFLNLNPTTFLPSNQFFPFASAVTNSQERVISSLTLQDEFSINQNLKLTSGIRYDLYDNDIGSATTPRIAIVYHTSDNHSFRAQYAEAFRPPTFLEQGGALSGSISPETIETVEFGYDYSRHGFTFKSVIFRSNLKNLITFVNVSPFGFSNTDMASLQGVEFEFSKRLNQKLKLQGNLSLLKTKDDKTGEALLGSAKVLANAHLTYKLNQNVSLDSHFNYVGKRAREVSDLRSQMGSYLQSNVSISVRELAEIPQLTLSAGINNVFNQDIRFQSGVDTYEGDYPISDSRSLWLKMVYAIN